MAITAMKLAVFTIIFNLACGILSVAVGGFTDPDLGIGYKYQSDRNTYTGFNGSVSAPGAETASGWWIKFVDFISIGYYQKIQSFLDSTIFGILGILKGMHLMDPAYEIYFYGVISIIYMLGIIEVFTSRKTVNRGL